MAIIELVWPLRSVPPKHAKEVVKVFFLDSSTAATNEEGVVGEEEDAVL